MTREELFQWVKQEYGTEAEYPWKDSNAVLRRADNDKWYGVILSVAGSKLGLEDGRSGLDLPGGQIGVRLLCVEGESVLEDGERGWIRLEGESA